MGDLPHQAALNRWLRLIEEYPAVFRTREQQVEIDTARIEALDARNRYYDSLRPV